jgi:hypothetical protein
MNPALTATIVSACLLVAVFLGIRIRSLVPEHHLSADTKDTVKLAMGLVATMAALLLGLLVSAAKGTYDAERNQVIQIAARAAFLDRVLALYGPEAAEARARFRASSLIRLDALGGRRDFSDPRIGPALWRLNPDFQPADGQRLESACEMKLNRSELKERRNIL